MHEDAELLRRYAEDHQEQAFAELVHRHLNLVYFVALRQVGGDAHRAEEVAQDVFIALGRKAASLIDRPVLTGWLYVSTCFAAAKAARSYRRQRNKEQEAQIMNECSLGASREIDWDELGPVIDDAVLHLPERDREAILLRFFSGMQFADMGRKLGMTEDGARLRLDRALEKMRSSLQRRGISSTATALASVLANHPVTAAPGGLASTIAGAVLAKLAIGNAATGTTSVLKFMAMTKIQIGIAGILGVLALGCLSYESARARRAEELLSQASQESGNLVQRLSESDRKVAALQRQVADLMAGTQAGATGKKQNVSGVASADGAAGAKTAQKVPAEILGFPHSILNDPVKRQKYLVADAAMYAGILSRFFSGLSQEQQGQLLSLRTELVSQELDLASAALEEGVASDPNLQTQFDQLNSAAGSQIRSAIGDAAAQQVQQAMNSIPQRNIADELASLVYATGTPLTASQADQLVQILSAQNVGSTLSRSYGGFGTQTALISDGAISQAQNVLSPIQVTALLQLQHLQQNPILPVIPAGKQSPAKAP